jgi:hypothetical protein
VAYEPVTAPTAGAPPVIPPPRPQFFAYVVVDVSSEPATPVRVELHRAKAREFVTWSPDAAHLRIRRAKVTLYAK